MVIASYSFAYNCLFSGGLFWRLVCSHRCLFSHWLKSLKDHALQVSDAIQQDDIDLAKQKVSYIVSRDTSELDEQAISLSTIESVLENGSDAIFAALFWFVLAGAPGVILYHLSNTLDAMWGYRYEKN